MGVSFWLIRIISTKHVRYDANWLFIFVLDLNILVGNSSCLPSDCHRSNVLIDYSAFHFSLGCKPNYESSERFCNKTQEREQENNDSSLTLLLLEGNPLRLLLLDCMMECLDSLYSCFYYTGCNSWFTSQMFLSKNRLAKSIEEEITRWHHMAGKSLTELIEQDVQHPSSDWPSSKIGSAEVSEEIEEDLLELMINELVIDFCQCWIQSEADHVPNHHVLSDDDACRCGQHAVCTISRKK